MGKLFRFCHFNFFIVSLSLTPAFQSYGCISCPNFSQWKSLEALSSAVYVCFGYRPCLYIKLSATAVHWDCCMYSICMHGVWVCASGRKCVLKWQTEKMREREWEVLSCVCLDSASASLCEWVCAFVWVHLHVYVWSRCWDLCVSLGRECRGPWTLLCFLLTRQPHTSTHPHSHRIDQGEDEGRSAPR